MLPDHLMRELRYIEVHAARTIRNLRVGTYTSRLRGAGFDFDQHKPYTLGDDVRRIDWNVTARFNLPFVRETHAERELNVMIAVDLSRSMSFGTARYSKKETMLFIAACLVFSALADQINTGFLAFTDRVLTYRAPRRTRAHGWRVLDQLWSADPPHTRTAILPAVRFLTGRLKTATVLFLVSDFMSDENLSDAGEMKVLAAKHDVIAVVVEDPAETALPPGSNAVTARDPESGATVRVGLHGKLRDDYRELVQRHRQELATSFYRLPVDHVWLRTDQSVIEPILRLFGARRRA